MDLPVCLLGDTGEQKRHLRWQCVIVPGRSPGVSMHADSGGIMGGMGGRWGEGGVFGECTTKRFIAQEAPNLSSDFISHQDIYKVNFTSFNVSTTICF